MVVFVLLVFMSSLAVGLDGAELRCLAKLKPIHLFEALPISTVYEVCRPRGTKVTIYAKHVLMPTNLLPREDGKVEMRLVPFEDFADPDKIAKIADPINRVFVLPKTRELWRQLEEKVREYCVITRTSPQITTAKFRIVGESSEPVYDLMAKIVRNDDSDKALVVIDGDNFPPQLSKLESNCAAFSMGTLEKFVKCYATQDFMKTEGLQF